MVQIFWTGERSGLEASQFTTWTLIYARPFSKKKKRCSIHGCKSCTCPLEFIVSFQMCKPPILQAWYTPIPSEMQAFEVSTHNMEIVPLLFSLEVKGIHDFLKEFQISIRLPTGLFHFFSAHLKWALAQRRWKLFMFRCILRFLQIFRLFIDSHSDRKIIHPNTQVLNTMILIQWQPYFQVTQFHPCSICNVICQTHYGLMRCITDCTYKELMINRTKCHVLSSGTIKKSKNIHLTVLLFGC